MELPHTVFVLGSLCLLCTGFYVSSILSFFLFWKYGIDGGEGGLFQMGLPDGLSGRLHTRQYGVRLTVHFIGRLDQIHFKLYAAADRGGYHITDLQALGPTAEEIEAAARWAMTHDVSSEFATILKHLLRELGYAESADRL